MNGIIKQFSREPQSTQDCDCSHAVPSAPETGALDKSREREMHSCRCKSCPSTVDKRLCFLPHRTYCYKPTSHRHRWMEPVDYWLQHSRLSWAFWLKSRTMKRKNSIQVWDFLIKSSLLHRYKLTVSLGNQFDVNFCIRFSLQLANAGWATFDRHFARVESSRTCKVGELMCEKNELVFLRL